LEAKDTINNTRCCYGVTQNMCVLMNRAWVQEGGEGEGGKERSKERRAHFYSDIYVNK